MDLNCSRILDQDPVPNEEKNLPVCSRAVDSPVISAVHIAVQITVVGSSLDKDHQTLKQIGCCCCCLLCC